MPSEHHSPSSPPAPLSVTQIPLEQKHNQPSQQQQQQQPPQENPRQQNASIVSESQRRKSLLVFLKVLQDYLLRQDPSLNQQVKFIVADCIRRNRGGDPNYTPLVTPLERRVKAAVGSHHWAYVTMTILHARHPHRQPYPQIVAALRRKHRQQQKQQTHRQLSPTPTSVSAKSA